MFGEAVALAVLRRSRDHVLTQLAHQPCKMRAPAHIHATVRTGFSVRTCMTSRRGWLAALRSESGVNDVPLSSNEVGVVGSKSAVKARREVCTPTREVYRANGKNVSGSSETADCPCADTLLAAEAFALRVGIEVGVESGRDHTSNCGGQDEVASRVGVTRAIRSVRRASSDASTLFSLTSTTVPHSCSAIASLLYFSRNSRMY